MPLSNIADFLRVLFNAISFNQLMIYLSLKPRKGCIYIESYSIIV